MRREQKIHESHVSFNGYVQPVILFNDGVNLHFFVRDFSVLSTFCLLDLPLLP